MPELWKPAGAGRITANFHWREAACNHCGRVYAHEEVVKTALMMEEVRSLLNTPIIVNSWCRCPEYNKHLEQFGADPTSFHMVGKAVDFVTRDLTPREVQAALKGHDGGMGRYRGFTHVDRGPLRRW